MPSSPEFESLLRSAGLRVTAPRMSILRALSADPHSDTDAVIGVVREDIGAVSRQSVYDGLRVLTTAGLVRQFQPMGSVARYELRTDDNHHHIVCRECGSIVDADCAVGEAPCLAATDDAGFDIVEAEVIYWGTCPACSKATSTGSHTTARKKERRV